MKRIVVGLVAFAVLLVVIAAPGLGLSFGSGQDTGTEPTRITNYAADFDVSADGTMKVTEVITVDFPSYVSRHGIFRFFDRYDDNAPGLRREPSDVRVLRDGSPEPYTEYEESNGRYTVLRIGSEQVTLPSGEHTFIIKYTIDDVLLPVDGTRSRFYWNLIPGGWAQQIDRAKLTVRLPARTTGTKCAVKVGATSGCTVKTKTSGVLRVSASNLAPRTPVTLTTNLAMAPPTTSRGLLWAGRWDPVLGGSVLGLLVILGLAAMAAAAGVQLSFTVHEPRPGYPLLYTPPEGIGPAQAQYILNEGLDNDAFVATMMYAAERGAVDLDQSEGRWTMTGTHDAPAGDPLDVVTTQVLRGLGVSAGKSFVADRKNVSTGRVLQQVIEKQRSTSERWAADEGLMTVAGIGAFGRMAVLLAAAGALALALFNPFTMSVMALVPGAFAASATSLTAKGSGTKRTRAGRDLWSRVGGFRRVLATPSSQVRFEFSARRELYTTYLPWAVAFGVAEEWAGKYRIEMGTEPPVPAYFAGAYAGGSSTNNFVGQMVTDFDSTVKSSISAYEASIRPTSDSGGSSSSGGGGGFSGGGGGGGGGGGSW